MAEKQNQSRAVSTIKPADLQVLKNNVVDVVSGKIQEYVGSGQLHMPPDYSPENAMKAAWLVLQETQTKDKQPALTACTQNSIANSLLDMVIQGLNPAKKQCYFIAYGKQLVCQRSYFGTMAVTMRLTGCNEPRAEIVYEGDEFEYEITATGKKITKHTQKLENIDGGKIRAAYCTIDWPEQARPQHTEIMTIAQIKKSWEKSKMNPSAKDSTHSEYSDQMAIRTVINRACKSLLNSSSDAGLLIERFNQAETALAEAEVEEAVTMIGEGEVIDFEGDQAEEERAPDPEPDPGPEPDRKEKEEEKNGGQMKIGNGPDF